MNRIGPRTALSETWRYALLGGLAALPFVAASYWQTGSHISLNAVFWGGLLAGYLVKRRGTESSPVGLRAGVVGSLPALWFVADGVSLVREFSQPVWFSAAQSVALLGLAIFTVLLGAFVGALGGRLGGWLAEQTGHPREPATA